MTSFSPYANWVAFCIFLTPLWLTGGKLWYYFNGVNFNVNCVSSVPDQPCFVTMCRKIPSPSEFLFCNVLIVLVCLSAEDDVKHFKKTSAVTDNVKTIADQSKEDM